MIRRNRILRQTVSVRSLVRETMLNPSDFIVPVFIIEGEHIKEEISSMPNYFRYSLDLAVKELKECYELGLRCALLFVKVPDGLKDNPGKEALNEKGLMQRSIREIKKALPDMQAAVPDDIKVSYEFDQSGYVINSLKSLLLQALLQKEALFKQLVHQTVAAAIDSM